MSTNEIENEDSPSESLRAMEEMMEYEKTDHERMHNNDPDNMHSNSERSVKRRCVVTAEEAPFDISYHPGRVKLYSPPRQRQRWGDNQVLPRVNWGDIFFDLFYVAATYNVSYILVTDPTPKGLLYAAGTFFPVMGFWLAKLSYDARFVYEEDIFHRITEITFLVVIATAVLYMRPVEYMSNSKDNKSMFLFSLVLVVERLMAVLLYVEIYFFGVGQTKALKSVALSTIKLFILSAIFYAAAAILAGIEYYGEDKNDSGEERYLAEAGTSNYKSEESSSHTDIPIWLVLIGYAVSVAYQSIMVVCFFPGGGRHKEMAVPLNVEFTMHRYGEWINLMLGESVFSILSVYVPRKGVQFQQTFFCSILTVIFLQVLHFKSEPISPDNHAFRRHKNAGIAWSALQQIYSLALVTLGAVFTFFLTFAVDEGRRLLNQRVLAGSESDSDDVLIPAAHMFSASLTVVFACLDTTTLLHLGIKESHNRCVCKNTRKKNVKGIFLITVRLGVLAFTATLSQWEQEPENLSLLGLICILTQLILRRLGGKYLGHNSVHVLETAH